MSEKVSNKTEITYPLQGTDTIYIIRGGVSYKGEFADLFRGFLKFVVGFEGYLIIPAENNTDGTRVQENDVLIGKGAYFNGAHVTMRALQDDPNEDSHFITGLNAEEY